MLFSSLRRSAVILIISYEPVAHPLGLLYTLDMWYVVKYVVWYVVKKRYVYICFSWIVFFPANFLCLGIFLHFQKLQDMTSY